MLQSCRTKGENDMNIRVALKREEKRKDKHLSDWMYEAYTLA